MLWNVFSPVERISVFTLIRTDTILDLSRRGQGCMNLNPESSLKYLSLLKNFMGRSEYDWWIIEWKKFLVTILRKFFLGKIMEKNFWKKKLWVVFFFPQNKTPGFNLSRYLAWETSKTSFTPNQIFPFRIHQRKKILFWTNLRNYYFLP